MTTHITVDVKITSTSPSLTAEYKSSTNGVSTNGDIEIPPGEDAVITFVPVQSSPIPNWSFQSQWVTIAPLNNAPPGPVPGATQSPTAVVVDDNDSNKSGTDYQYEYTLYTTLGQLDPRIVNKTGTG